MSLDSGQILGSDLSPNANILGTQLADKTIQLRNLADGVIPAAAIEPGGVVKVTEQGTATIAATSHATGSISNNDVSVTLLGTYTQAPLVLSYVLTGTAGGSWGGLWGTDAMIPLSYGGTPISITEANITQQFVTTTSILFREVYINSTGSTKNNIGFTIYYYVVTS